MSGVCAITGGGGFIGAYLVRRLVSEGWEVRVIDNLARGTESRLENVLGDIHMYDIDVRDAASVGRVVRGCDVVFHLAAINGTENFYKHPELVLDVGLRGALAVVEACIANNVYELVVASSAEVYQTPPNIPTAEDVGLSLPDSLNPRYSYGGSKIISELVAFNYGRQHFKKVQVFRPHNVYGPDMGWKHVIPQFITRALDCRERGDTSFEIQGDGSETRAFAFVEDVVSGIMCMYHKGSHRSIYHIGNDEEVTIRQLVEAIGAALDFPLSIAPTAAAVGGTLRRCPDIAKLQALGYQPAVPLSQGIQRTLEWYEKNDQRPVNNPLM